MSRFHRGHSVHLRRARLLGLAATVAAAMVIAAAGSIPSLAAERPVGLSAVARAAIQENGGPATVNNQNTLSDFRSWIFQQPDFSTSGYVGTIDDLAAEGLTVMWYGPSTPLLESIITEGESRGITVSVQPSSYSLAQLTTAARLVFTQAAAGEWAGFQVEAVGALSAADDGLTVDGAYTSASSAGRAAQVRSLSTTIDGVPVQVVPGRLASLASGRDADTTPFNSGGLMVSNTSANGDIMGSICSAGFGVTMGSDHYVSTARHCIFENGGAKNYADYVARNYYGESAPSANKYGNGSGEYTSDGGATILTSYGSPLAFVGSYTTSAYLPVEKLSNVGLNDLVCTEGGNSGGHCNIKVTNMLKMFNDTDGTFETIEGDQQTSGAIAGIQGDSGSGVITILPDGNVGAAGMFEGVIGSPLQTGSACAPAHDLGTNKCGTGVLFSSFKTILDNAPNVWTLYTSS